MEDMVRIGLLMDFYGGLLTEKQRRILESYYLHNLSLAEIAAEEHISRQAVYDLIHRSVLNLEDLEKKLMFFEADVKRKQVLSEVAADLRQMMDAAPEEMKENLGIVLEKLQNIGEI